MNRHLPRLGMLLGLLATLAPVPVPAGADEVLPAVILGRKFPQGQFCALPVNVTFTTPASAVVITFTANEFVDDGSGAFAWTAQSIDNVTLATTATVTANSGPPPASSSSENCYIGDPTPVSYFYSNRAVPMLLKELCDDDPQARGWAWGSRAGFDAGRTAARNVELETGFTGGSIRLGDGSGTPGPGVLSSASVIVSGLTIGESYDLGAWWYAGFVRFPHDVDYISISVATVSGTPVARRSWGGVKATYR